MFRCSLCLADLGSPALAAVCGKAGFAKPTACVATWQGRPPIAASIAAGDDAATAAAADGTAESLDPFADGAYLLERVPYTTNQTQSDADSGACWTVVNGKLPMIAQNATFGHYTLDQSALKVPPTCAPAPPTRMSSAACM